jgi:hypothetical protein
MSDDLVSVVLDQLVRDARQSIFARDLASMKDFPGGAMSEERARRWATSPGPLEYDVAAALAKSKDPEVRRLAEAIKTFSIRITVDDGKGGKDANAIALDPAVGSSWKGLLKQITAQGLAKLEGLPAPVRAALEPKPDPVKEVTPDAVPDAIKKRGAAQPRQGIQEILEDRLAGERDRGK